MFKDLRIHIIKLVEGGSQRLNLADVLEVALLHAGIDGLAVGMLGSVVGWIVKLWLWELSKRREGR